MNNLMTKSLAQIVNEIIVRLLYLKSIILIFAVNENVHCSRLAPKASYQQRN